MKDVFLNFEAFLQLYQPWILPIVAIGIILEIIFLVLVRKGCIEYKTNSLKTVACGLILSFSIAVVIIMTLCGRTQGKGPAFRFQVFGSYKEAFLECNTEILLQIIMNIVMFVPIGFLLPCCFELFEKGRHVITIIFISSTVIECVQGVARIGLFEFDDIIGNVLGSGIGFFIYWMMGRIGKMRVNYKSNFSEEDAR